LLTSLALATAPALATAAPQQPTATHVVAAQSATSAPVKAAATDSAGYAQRERRDQKVASYEGGSVVVIGISGGALVVLLLILLLI